MDKLLIASHNSAKVNDYKQFLRTLPYHIISLADLNMSDDVEEDGKTFIDNALIKAEFFHHLTGLATLADDGGLEIDALDGEPGIKSRRWKGYRMTDQEMVDYTLKRLEGMPDYQRTARLRMVICFFQPKQKPIFVEGVNEGKITQHQQEKIQDGYPFRSIFIITALNKMFSELTKTEQAQINHRKNACEKLIQKLDH